MKKTYRHFYPETAMHVYQRMIDKGVIFYEDIHILFHFSIFCIMARRNKVRVLSMTYMIDHFHVCCTCADKQHFDECFGRTASVFTAHYNAFMHRRGPMFQSPFDYSAKKTLKETRSCVNYIHNNPVEKNLCKRAVDFKWNILKYGLADTRPQEDVSSKSSQMSSAIIALEDRVRAGRYLSYDYLVQFKNTLTKQEWQKLTDIIIKTYNVIDYQGAAKMYGGMDAMITAADSNTGCEYEIKEAFGAKSDVVYFKMARWVRSVPGWSPYRISNVLEVLQKLSDRFGCTYHQLSSFMHVEYGLVKESIHNNLPLGMVTGMSSKSHLTEDELNLY